MNIQDFSQNDLILFCVLRIEQGKEDCTFERLVYECFITFPERFSFYAYRLPDSIKLDRQLRTMRKLRLVTGSNKYGWKLTERGYRLAIQLQKTISSASFKSPSQRLSGETLSKKSKGGRKEEIMINKIASSSLYKKYENNVNLPLTVDEVRIVFFGTLETPLKSLLDNIEYIEDIAKKSENAKLFSFIGKCKKFIKNKSKG
jgi:hypothetical protein